ncbi:TPA: WecB/TagA/CpsF family glycosyltransferase [Serratia fonticola]|nr:WecB/TagA/CpsF family glycosyltransferase [Serratia fonticola]
MKANVMKIIETAEVDIIDLLKGGDGIYTFLNPVSYLVARRNKSVYHRFNGLFSDGSLLSIFIRLFYRRKVKRYSFDMTSCAPIVFDYAIKNSKSIYLIGSDAISIENAVSLLLYKYPSIIIRGHRNGFFCSENERISVANEIIMLNPDIVIVGMGAITQENFLLTLRDQGFSKIGFTCGGFFHQLNEHGVDYYPKWVNKFNLRFIYRMLKERHTRKRYLTAGLLFPVLFFYDRFFCCK